MTILAGETTSHASVRAALRRPGMLETLLVPLTMFVLLYETPEAWVLDASAEDTGVPITTALTLALTGFAFLRVAGNLDLVIRLIKLEGALTLFVMLTAASIFWSANLWLTMRETALVVACFFWAAYLVVRFELPQILRLLAWSSIPGTIFNYAFIFALPEYGVSGAGQWTGVFGQKNALGYSATLMIPLLVVVAGSDRPRRVLYYSTAALNAVLLVGSESKTMLVATVIPTVLLAVYHGFRGRKTLRGAVILSLVGAAIFMVLFVTANLAVIAELLNKDVTLTGRTDLWRDLIPIAMERPLLGWGANAPFGGYFSPVHEVWIQNRWDPSHAHNAGLQLWLELGVVGVALFLVTYFRALGRAIEVVRRVPGRVGLWPLCFLTTALLISISESGVTTSMPSFVLYVLCIWSCGLNYNSPLLGSSAARPTDDPVRDQQTSLTLQQVG